MTDKPIIINLDLTGCKYLGEIHQRIKIAFDFPDWYGENWSAFWDLLSCPNDYTIVEVRGINTLPDELIPSGQKIIELLERNKKKYIEFMKRQSKFDRRFDYRIID